MVLCRPCIHMRLRLPHEPLITSSKTQYCNGYHSQTHRAAVLSLVPQLTATEAHLEQSGCNRSTSITSCVISCNYVAPSAKGKCCASSVPATSYHRPLVVPAWPGCAIYCTSMSQTTSLYTLKIAYPALCAALRVLRDLDALASGQSCVRSALQCSDLLRGKHMLDLLGTLPWCCFIGLWAMTQHHFWLQGGLRA